jgi:class 3 adenylate cyclase
MRQLLRKILDLGVADDTPRDLAIALRATNLLALFMIVFSAVAAMASVLDAGSPLLALAILSLSLVYGMAMLCIAAGWIDLGRFALLIGACVHYIWINVALGRASGAPFWIVAMLGFPILTLARDERGKTILEYVILVVAFVVSQTLSNLYGPLILKPEATGVAFYIHLGQLTAVAGFGLYYYKNATVAAWVDLDAAREQIADLLGNMLPPSIATRLQHGQLRIADSHSEACVLFADLAGFSQLSRRLSPTHLVDVLNRMFSRFDEAALRLGIEKIKTIGDCYMVAAGVPSPRPDHAHALALMALDMQAAMGSVGAVGHLGLELRVGINSGPVIAGVIGRKRFLYDLWGDAVNTASRMESHGTSGRIQITRATKELLEDEFVCEPRGTISIKGKGEIEAWYLVSRRVDSGP